MTNTTTQSESTWPHRFAVAMVCVTFPLIWVGGLVTTYQAGMAVPDWPNTYGYNLFLYPPSAWLAGPFDLFIEHGHRLLGALVGLLTIGFVVAVFRGTTATRLRILALVALVGVCLQGTLGGMRVLFDQRTLAMIHGCVGPAFFALAVALAAMTSRRWLAADSPRRDAEGPRIQRLACFTVLLAYLQLLLGAQLRHTPVDVGPGYFRAAVYFHLLVAAAIVVHSLLLAGAVRRLQVRESGLRRPALALVALVLLQVCLGGASWVARYGFPQWLGEHVWTSGYTVQREDFVSAVVITGHVALGSLILVTALLAAMRSFRFLQRSPMAAVSCPRQLLEVAL